MKHIHIALKEQPYETAVRQTADIVVAGVGTATLPVILEGDSAEVQRVIDETVKQGHDRWQNWIVTAKTGADFAKEYTDSVTYGDVADYIEGFVKTDLFILTQFDAVLTAADEAVNRMLVRVLRGFMGKQRQIIIGLEDSAVGQDCAENRELREVLGLA